MRCLIDYIITNNDEKKIENNIKAIYNNNKLSFNDENDSIKITINKDNIIMIKDNNTSNIIFNFKNGIKTISKYFLKEYNSYLNTSILTNNLIIDDKNINIEYELWIEEEYMGKFKYNIKIKEM